ncbi:sodium-dependent neutral amino acid transporterB(0)AT1 [Striga asiatica]|uniref:Sodium-dependent neutral amino acid transporterB(0)AT1 n=1 Tax=Striga asiatica TaxID=4170 RepID=A0A5A7Q718_STRAF|nr:sodium-dependent neutral amino acid transporterB(0)AT1 [Striga asiatica]
MYLEKRTNNLSDPMPMNDNPFGLGRNPVGEINSNGFSSPNAYFWARKLAIDGHDNTFHSVWIAFNIIHGPVTSPVIVKSGANYISLSNLKATVNHGSSSAGRVSWMFSG